MAKKRDTTFGTYKHLGITRPKTATANDVCPICNDTASKRKCHNPCVFELHRIYA